MLNIAQIYAIWDGNAEALAADVGVPGVTARQWRNRRSIPQSAWGKIIEKAADRGHKLTLADFDKGLADLAKRSAA